MAQRNLQWVTDKSRELAQGSDTSVGDFIPFMRATLTDMGSAMATLRTPPTEMKGNLAELLENVDRIKDGQAYGHRAAAGMVIAIGLGYGRAMFDEFKRATRIYPSRSRVRTVGTEIGASLAKIDPNAAYFAKDTYASPQIPQTSLDVASRIIGSYHGSLREESTVVARSLVAFPEEFGGHELGPAVATGLLSEPLYPRQIPLVLIERTVPSKSFVSKVNDAISTLEHAHPPILTTDIEEQDSLHFGPVAPGVVTLTAAGREQIVTHLRANAQAMDS